MYQSKKKYLIFFTLGLIRLGNLTPSNNSLFDDEAIKSRFGSSQISLSVMTNDDIEQEEEASVLPVAHKTMGCWPPSVIGNA